ncbi:Nucleoside-diphosphate-sugar epimerase [Streptoalloteichus tenebrarius]|uniref:Nucleoside-diphosphate-sugar epimerase n=1 Tax=Streptoalloteichus tenebrarius (strain ATCC 17920 / DSM 40477 / JCM 4838 / CBS 697.72 / NBRC 16177 / NCIMB 11028 / NRRL B-12390 / A12253. 1 / ISP 5477) TaxID=1933 RepID=Q2MFI4_STRSD|nr:SDR family oxidoreductase [Streptoalloteichus tenebrarius]MCP2261357.1 Nucleoside-diphosphate-sugar epimerase [Streptoalloteichus tenebrarius]BFF00894.1 SDR family oxidoreductase [Streptoalloteichus tenebrarius]CAF33057.1 putative apramycin biosynthetic oxidoreductase 5 [Streptoalloteichus tenebrarius]
MNKQAGPDLVLVTGGAGYIGSVLTRRLLADQVRVRVLDSRIFGDGLREVSDPRLENVRGDIRDPDLFREALRDVDVVVHLAAVANDPSFDLNPELGRSVNFECLDHVMRLSKEAGVRRFVYASSASVYGISDSPEVDESHPLVPITDYNRYKALGEEILFPLTDDSFETVALRAATVCGVSTRQRLDLTVNLLTAQAVGNREITVFGGTQYRPNVHVEDLVGVYHRLVVDDSLGALNGGPINVGNENLPVAEIARIIATRVGRRIGAEITTTTTPTDDRRSYRLTSRRLRQVLGITPTRTVADACDDVTEAILDGRLPDFLTDPRYHNVRWMKDPRSQELLTFNPTPA